MYALVESGSITKIFTSPKGFVLNNNQYPLDHGAQLQLNHMLIVYILIKIKQMI